MAIQKLCNYSGCQNFALDGHIYCKEHYKEPKPFEKAKRNNEVFYNTQQWRLLRKEHLKKFLIDRCAKEYIDFYKQVISK